MWQKFCLSCLSYLERVCVAVSERVTRRGQDPTSIKTLHFIFDFFAEGWCSNTKSLVRQGLSKIQVSDVVAARLLVRTINNYNNYSSSDLILLHSRKNK